MTPLPKPIPKPMPPTPLVQPKPPVMPMPIPKSSAMPMPAVPPKGYVDDLDFIKKITSNQPRNTSGLTPKITPYNPMETNTIPPTGTTRTPIPATGPQYMKKGGKVKSSSAKNKVSTASSRGDGIAQRGKTKGRMV